MGKRSNFERIERDFYPTPREAVLPLLPHLQDNIWFIEPCAGDGQLIETLFDYGRYCLQGTDIEPQHPDIFKKDAFDLTLDDCVEGDYIITNPPWDRKILHPLINHFRVLKPTWLLFDANWMFTKQAKDYLPYCHKIVTIGRVKWIPNSPHTGKDDSCWYLFDRDKPKEGTVFYGRNPNV